MTKGVKQLKNIGSGEIIEGVSFSIDPKQMMIVELAKQHASFYASFLEYNLHQLNCNLIMAKAKKAAKKKAAKKRAEHYESKLKTDLSFDQLIAISVGKKADKRESSNK